MAEIMIFIKTPARVRKNQLLGIMTYLKEPQKKLSEIFHNE
jgi:hypothetical protein